ncbi:pilus assembly protein TadG-related protein [Cellulomonas carbonis]|uniref:Putative Flp pilus-assembly TadG-like N-terminal domain-containing protein n=1 Tax=Cellulomonas carbonis T26 TaxID=947969 RepID=A0A0A0BXJ5_9CELL|nr:hypothetical protein N868_04940 [Cellulomonas carbonis T26]GGB91489.1 membrane protein [Cellulomonas carbonis]
MTTRPPRYPAPQEDRGSVSVFVCIAVVGLLVLVGLVVDGGVKLRTGQRADTVAAEAARTGGQAVAVPTVVGHQHVTVDRAAAVQAATTYLTTTGHTGTAAIGPDGSTIQVTVTTTSPTTFLALIGVTSLTVTGHGEAALVHVTGAGP